MTDRVRHSRIVLRMERRALHRLAVTGLLFGLVSLCITGCFLLPNTPPISAIEADPLSGHAPLDVRLDAGTSSDLDGIIIAYRWSFDDGGSGSSVTTQHTFSAAGTYVAQLTVRDDQGAEATASVEIIVHAANERPTASFSYLPHGVLPGEPVRFDATASRDADGTIVIFSWQFGDGTTGTGAEVEHTYTEPGVYEAVLTAVDDDGAERDQTQTVLVVDAEQPPIASFSPTSAVLDPGETLELDASGSYGLAGEIVTYDWSFGDGATANGKRAEHQYTAAGTYHVLLTVTDSRGVASEAVGTMVVGVEPPLGDGDVITRSFDWYYDGTSRRIAVSVPEALYTWARAQPRDTWPYRDYDEYVLNPLDDILMHSVAQDLLLGSYDASASNALAFVQAAIRYVPDPGVFEYPRYPAETLVDEAGDCEDSAILYASLIRTMGHGALLVSVDTDGNGNSDHMVVFVPVDESFEAPSLWEYGGKLYAFAETASDGGYIPLGVDPWNLDPRDVHQTWNVSRVDTAPNMVKRLTQ